MGSQLPVRLEIDVEKRLEAIAVKTGTTKSGLIRLLAKTFVDQFVAANGEVTLPPNWKALLPEPDRRSKYAVPAESLGLSNQANSTPVDPEKVAVDFATVLVKRIRAKRKAT